MATSFNRFYSTELARLRAKSLEFAQNNPAVAPMLGAVSTDPDIERLLEGVAFLNGLTLQKLDDEFPEIVQELAHVLVPQFLRPLPAASLVDFTPKASLSEAAVIKAGTEIGSTPVDGVTCRFRTTADVHIHPMSLTAAATEQLSDGSQVLWLQFSAPEGPDGIDLPSDIRLFLSQEYASATNLFMLLGTQLKSLRLLDAHGNGVTLLPKLRFPAFDETLIPYPENAFPAFGRLQELLFFPQKFLFFEVPDVARGRDTLRGEKFRLEFVFHKSSIPLPAVSTRDFVLNVTPVVNLFEHEAEPIHLDHESAEYLIVPSGTHKRQFDIHSILAVTGYMQAESRTRTYLPFSLLAHDGRRSQASYRTSMRPSLVGDAVETYISVAYGEQDVIGNETLSLRLLCTNRYLPESLKLGDISRPTSTSPERFSFRNITPVTASIPPPSGEKLLWDVISHTTLNLLSLARIENLSAMLQLYNATCTHDPAVRSANSRQIEGLTGMSVTRETRLLRGAMIQGQHIVLTCDEKNWASPGALYLWGSVLDRFLSCYAGINSYTRFEIRDKNSGTHFKWPIRMGAKPLL
jgi:type VI secretion system protein ImpG